MARVEKNHSDFYEIVSVFRRRIWLLVCFLVGVLAVILIYNSFVPPLYETEFSIIYEEAAQPMKNIDFFRSSIRRETFLSNQIEEIKSRQFFTDVVKQLPENIIPSFQIPEDLNSEELKIRHLAYLLNMNTDVSMPSNNSNVVRIAYRNNSPEVSFEVARIISDVVQTRAIELRKKHISSSRQLIVDQLGYFKIQLDSTERRLRDFKETNNISSLDQETEQLLKKITEAEVIFTSAKANKKSVEQRLDFINQKIQSQQEEFVPLASETISPKIEKIKDKLVDLELQRTDLLMNGYGNNHPKLLKLNDEINITRDNLFKESKELLQDGKFIDPVSQLKSLFQEKITLEADLKSYDAQVNTLNQVLNKYDKKIQELPNLEMQLARFTRDVQTNEKIYTMLLEERERARIVEAQNLGNIRLIDPPQLPQFPISPKKGLNILVGLLIGLILGSVIIFIVESMDNSLRTFDQVEKFTDLPILGTIPKIKPNTNGNTKSHSFGDKIEKDDYRRLITVYDQNSHVTEAFRMLRTNLQYSTSDFRSNTIMVTSSQPSEGKSTTAVNLAIITARMGYDTLLIDGDLRRPILHELFKLDRKPGLTDLLNSENFKEYIEDHFTKKKRQHWEEYLHLDGNRDIGDHEKNKDDEPYQYLINNQKLDFDNISKLYNEIDNVANQLNIEHLSVLTSGSLTSNPSEIVGSKAMNNFMSLVKKKYDIVILDSPPVLVVSDTSVLGTLADGILIVCAAGQVSQSAISRSIELLEKGKSKILGLVLNQINDDKLSIQYKKYYQSAA